LARTKKILQYLRNEEYYFVNCSLVYDDDEADSMLALQRDSAGLEERIAAELRLQKKTNPSIDYPSLFMLMDIKNYLKDDLLLLLDKILMASSIEGRVPFLDHRIVEFALSLPINLKIQKNNNKYILKRWLENKLGREFVQRPKIGFGTPIHSWYDNSFKKYAREILSDPKVKARGYINPDKVDSLIEKNQYLVPQKVFNLVCLELWFREYYDK
jgi:asparagine synthetase B (glutamine-hydrolysing)